MTHEESALYVPDLAKGRLTPEEEAAVRAHMAGCADCTGLAGAYDVVSAALRGQEVRSEHPDSADLVAHAMDESVRPEIERHFESCADCASQAAAIRAAESELSGRRVSSRAWSAWAAAAAACLLAGFVGWMVRPDAPLAPEAIAFPLLTSATRGAEGPIVIPVAAGQRSIAVAVAPALPSGMADGEELRIEVRDAAGRVVYSSRSNAGDVRRLSGKSGAFALVLPAASLPSGDALLSIRDGSGGELLTAPFRVRRE